MGSSSLKQRLFSSVPISTAAVEYADGVLVAIPGLFSVGMVILWLLHVQFHVAMIGSSLLATVVVLDALYRNPPTSDP
jgi:hypothetical protein